LLIAALGVLVMEMELFGEWASDSEKQMTVVDYGISTLAYTVDAEFDDITRFEFVFFTPGSFQAGLSTV